MNTKLIYKKSKLTINHEIPPLFQNKFVQPWKGWLQQIIGNVDVASRHTEPLYFMYIKY